MQQRQTAYHTWIAPLINGQFVSAEGDFLQDFVVVGDKKISRVNLIGTVVDVFINQDSSFGSITLDDGTATIRVKVFRENIKNLRAIRGGELVNCVGMVKKYNEEINISGEVIRLLDDPHWLLVRQLMLAKNTPLSRIQQDYSTLTQSPQPTTQAEPPAQTESTKQVLAIINAREEGVTLVDLEQQTGLPRAQILQLIENLVNEGEIYQFKPGHFKRL